MAGKILVASGNQGKIAEIRQLLVPVGFEVLDIGQFGNLDEVVEDGTTFRENALKKARTRADETGCLTLADDSGLEVDCLDGRPGVYSARYAGPDATDEENNRKLLAELQGIPRERRTARFKCVMALVDPVNNDEETVEGSCEGLIIEQPRGSNGFGYDPLFLLTAYQQTMAELSLSVKNKTSHRARALRKLKEILIARYS